MGAKIIRLPKWHLKSLMAGADFEAHSSKILAHITNLSVSDQSLHLRDLRAVHKMLFENYTPAGGEVYAGTYRGTSKTPLSGWKSSVRAKVILPGTRAVDRVAPPDTVSQEMAELSKKIDELWASDCPVEEYYRNAVGVFADFLKIHPFVDGNGHLSRLLMAVLMRHRKCFVGSGWTMHPRPYSAELSYFVQNYESFPGLLETYLLRWFCDFTVAEYYDKVETRDRYLHLADGTSVDTSDTGATSDGSTGNDEEPEQPDDEGEPDDFPEPDPPDDEDDW